MTSYVFLKTLYIYKHIKNVKYLYVYRRSLDNKDKNNVYVIATSIRKNCFCMKFMVISLRFTHILVSTENILPKLLYTRIFKVFMLMPYARVKQSKKTQLGSAVDLPLGGRRFASLPVNRTKFRLKYCFGSILVISEPDFLPVTVRFSFPVHLQYTRVKGFRVAAP